MKTFNQFFEAVDEPVAGYEDFMANRPPKELDPFQTAAQEAQDHLKQAMASISKMLQNPMGWEQHLNAFIEQLNVMSQNLNYLQHK